MRAIKVSYRAVFEQPIGVLNPMGLKLPGPCAIEVYGTGDRWKVRTLTGVQFKKLGEHPGASAAMHVVQECHAKQLEPWQMWGTPPSPADPPAGYDFNARLILPAEVKALVKEGIERVYWLEPEDFTHIIHAPNVKLPDGKIRGADWIPPAACGAHVKVDHFINNKANVEPTCKGCALVWREHYQEQYA